MSSAKRTGTKRRKLTKAQLARLERVFDTAESAFVLLQEQKQVLETEFNELIARKYDHESMDFVSEQNFEDCSFNEFSSDQISHLAKLSSNDEKITTSIEQCEDLNEVDNRTPIEILTEIASSGLPSITNVLSVPNQSQLISLESKDEAVTDQNSELNQEDMEDFDQELRKFFY